MGWPPGAGWPLTISFTRARPRTGGLCESPTCPGTKRDGRSTKKPVSESCYSCTQSRVLGQNLGPSRPQLDDPGPEGRVCPPLPGTSRSSVSRRGASPGLSPSNPGRIVVVPSQAPCQESRVPVEGRVIRLRLFAETGANANNATWRQSPGVGALHPHPRRSLPPKTGLRLGGGYVRECPAQADACVCGV